jgi:hypothetical protein
MPSWKEREEEELRQRLRAHFALVDGETPNRHKLAVFGEAAQQHGQRIGLEKVWKGSPGSIADGLSRFLGGGGMNTFTRTATKTYLDWLDAGRPPIQEKAADVPPEFPPYALILARLDANFTIIVRRLDTIATQLGSLLTLQREVNALLKFDGSTNGTGEGLGQQQVVDVFTEDPA